MVWPLPWAFGPHLAELKVRENTHRDIWSGRKPSLDPWQAPRQVMSIAFRYGVGSQESIWALRKQVATPCRSPREGGTT